MITTVLEWYTLEEKRPPFGVYVLVRRYGGNLELLLSPEDNASSLWYAPKTHYFNDDDIDLWAIPPRFLEGV